jgi:trimethylamine--corrinoid protein Co-methyltransferase
MLLPMELPPMLRAIKTGQLSLLKTTKHIMGSPESREELPFFLEMLEAAGGGRAQLKKRPILSAIINPVSPLQNSGALVDNLMDMIDYTPPVFMQFLPLAGATAPITLAGTILQANAEFLGNMALYQLASPGWPIIWASACGSLDMRTGVYVGGPEAMLMGLALIEMGKYYNVPVNTFGTSSAETHSMTYRTGMEAMFGVLNSALSQVDNMWWPADIDRFNTQDLAVTMMGCEPVRQILRMRRGFSMDYEHMLADVIMKMGFEAEYMGDPSTKKFFREEHLLSDIFPRTTYDEWHGAGEPTEESVALARAKKILASHEPVQVDPGLEKELERIYAAAEKALIR